MAHKEPLLSTKKNLNPGVILSGVSIGNIRATMRSSAFGKSVRSAECRSIWVLVLVSATLACVVALVGMSWRLVSVENAEDAARCSRPAVTVFSDVTELTYIAPPTDLFDTDVADYPNDQFSDPTEGATGRLHRNSEVEPGMDFDPRDPDRIVVTYQQDRWSNGGARGAGARYSTDGGRSWAQGNLKSTRFDGLPNRDVDRATDTWVACSSNGVCYASVEHLNYAGSINITVARSTDQGYTWSMPVDVITPATSPSAECAFQDKNTIYADPYDSDYAYLTVTNYDFCNGLQIQLARTTDGGDSWEAPVTVHQYPVPDFDNPYGTLVFTNGPQMVSPTPGQLLLCWLRSEGFIYLLGYPNGDTNTLVCARSYDRGATWRSEEIVAAHAYVGQQYPADNLWQGFAMADYELNTMFRDGTNLPSLAVHRPSGRIYMVASDSRFKQDRFYTPFIVMSEDGGATWTDAVPVAPAARLDAQGTLGTVAVLDDGRVGVLYCTDRNDVGGDSIKSLDYYLSVFDARLTTLLDEVRVTPSSFDGRQAPNAIGPMIGDYAQLRSFGSGFYAVFSTNNNLGLPPLAYAVPENIVVTEDRSSIRFARIEFVDSDRCFDAADVAAFRAVTRPLTIASSAPGYFPPPCPVCNFAPEYCPVCNATNLAPPPYDFEHGVAAIMAKMG